MTNNEQSIKLVESKFTENSWLKNSSGKRISKKFVLYNSEDVGDFVILNTSTGYYVYHNSVDYILVKAATNASVIKITDSLFGVKYYTKRNNSYQHFARIYNEKGDLLQSGLNDLRSMKNGLFAVCKDCKWGFWDENLKVIINPQWEEVSSFNENGYAVVNFKDRNKIGVIDKKSSYMFPPLPYVTAMFETPNLLRVRNKSGKYGIITVDGKVVIPDVYNNIKLKGHFFIVTANGKYGLIDIKGNEIFECIYPELIETDKKFVVHDFARLEVSKAKEIIK